MIYDGDCAFCAYWIGRWHARTGERVEYAPYQEAAGRFPEIPRTRFERAVHLIEPDGRVSSGAEAVFRVLPYARRSAAAAAMLWLYRRVPGVAALCEWAYRFVAGHRPQFTMLMRFVPGWRRSHQRRADRRDV
ncbi:MAG TPA: DCC1-like thiol-disulfide oxidoreductase family protein [Phycisphaerae bacterium]|jgi:predicted DCC family thiol-disulfide oxidoreductase YuxK